MRKSPAANDSDIGDFGSVSLDHGKGQVDPVSLNGRDRCDHVCSIQTAVDVLSFEFLLSPVKLGLVKGPALGQANIDQGFFQDFFVKLLGADKFKLGHRGALFHDHHQHICANLDANILEQTQGEQGADGSRAFVIAVEVSDLERQGDKHSARFDTLQALETDIAHRERVYGPAQLGQSQKQYQGQPGPKTKSVDLHVDVVSRTGG